MASRFVSAEEKYKDNLNSAFSLLFVGIVGLAFIILLNLGIIPLGISKNTLLLSTIVLGAVFVIFIIVGIKSYIDSKKIKSNISQEEDNKLDIALYLTDNLSKDDVDNSIDGIDELSDEELYIARTEYMENFLKSKFEDADEALIETLIEDIYDEIFTQ